MKIFASLLLSLLIVLAPAAQAHPVVSVESRVVAVVDGDTIKILDEHNELFKIRLAEIDAPEKKQPFGMKAKQMLSDLCFNETVIADIQTTDRYGRGVARVYKGDKDPVDINAEMVKQGGAWVYRQYSHDPAYLKFEEQARAEKRGLWALQDDQRIPPWEWRKLKREH
jgi:endonuclease YncB( thermonuclease family)